MASEYLKKKYQDVKPDEPVVLTKKQKVQNWWYYHKIHVLVGAIVIVAVALFLRDLTSRVEPDCQIAYVGQNPLTEEETAQIISAVEEITGDLNGDGKVHVALSPFCIQPDNPMNYAENVRLVAELTGKLNQIFLLEDPVAFQEQYGILMQKDGAAFTEGDRPTDCLYYAVKDCPALNSIGTMEDLFIARPMAAEDDDMLISALWDSMTAGAAEPEEVKE